MGLQVEAFASAEDFLSSPYWRDSSCLILDVRMPGMNGLELERYLALACHPIPVIFITAHRDDSTYAQALCAFCPSCSATKLCLRQSA
jgi:FixJ family two-component response regulator